MNERNVSAPAGAAPPVPPPLPDQLEKILRRMRMPYPRKAAPEVLATARAQRWDPTELVRVLLEEEIRGRDDAGRGSAVTKPACPPARHSSPGARKTRPSPRPPSTP